MKSNELSFGKQKLFIDRLERMLDTKDIEAIAGSCPKGAYFWCDSRIAKELLPDRPKFSLIWNQTNRALCYFCREVTNTTSPKCPCHQHSYEEAAKRAREGIKKWRKKMELDKLLVPGTSFSVYYNKGNLNNRQVHVRAIVDDEYVVYRVWFKSKGYFRYNVERIHYFDVLLRNGRIRDVKYPKNK